MKSHQENKVGAFGMGGRVSVYARINVDAIVGLPRLGEVGETETMHGANMSHRQFQRYVAFLE